MLSRLIFTMISPRINQVTRHIVRIAAEQRLRPGVRTWFSLLASERRSETLSGNQVEASACYEIGGHENAADAMF